MFVVVVVVALAIVQHSQANEQFTLLYGRTLSRSIPVNASSDEVTKIVQLARQHIFESRAYSPTPRLEYFSKHILHHSDDHTTPTINTYEDAYGRIHRKEMIMGVRYALELAWDLPARHALSEYSHARQSTTQRHRLILTRDRTGRFSLFSHTILNVDVDVDGGSGNEGEAEWSMNDGSHLTSQEWDYLHNEINWVPEWSHVDSECPAIDTRKSLQALYQPRGYTTQGNEKFASFRLLNLNIWNTNGFNDGHYNERMRNLGNMIATANADIIALQEVRHDANRDSQPYTLLFALPRYQFVFQPAMSYPEGAMHRVEEGVAVYSRFPIVQHDYLLLPRIDGDNDDVHQRVCLRVDVLTPQDGLIQIFVTHLSLSEKARDASVVAIWEWMQKSRLHDVTIPQLVMGDLNANPDTPAMQFLAGRQSLNGVQTDLTDAWTIHHPEPRAGNEYEFDDDPRDPGLTFSALDEQPCKRIDYVFYRSSPSRPLVSRSIATYPEYMDWVGKVPLSDHFGLLVDFDMVKPL